MSEQELRVTVDLDMTGFLKALEKVSRLVHRPTLAMMRPASRRRHARRCHICSPIANPKPLSIDGRAYRQRTKKRGKR